MSSYNIPDIIFTDCLIASASGIYTYNKTFLLKLRPSASVAAVHIFLQLSNMEITLDKWKGETNELSSHQYIQQKGGVGGNSWCPKEIYIPCSWEPNPPSTPTSMKNSCSTIIPRKTWHFYFLCFLQVTQLFLGHVTNLLLSWTFTMCPPCF